MRGGERRRGKEYCASPRSNEKPSSWTMAPPRSPSKKKLVLSTKSTGEDWYVFYPSPPPPFSSSSLTMVLSGSLSKKRLVLSIRSTREYWYAFYLFLSLPPPRSPRRGGSFPPQINSRRLVCLLPLSFPLSLLLSLSLSRVHLASSFAILMDRDTSEKRAPSLLRFIILRFISSSLPILFPSPLSPLPSVLPSLLSPLSPASPLPSPPLPSLPLSVANTITRNRWPVRPRIHYL